MVSDSDVHGGLTPVIPMGLSPEQYEMYLKMMILRAEKNEGYRVHLLARWFSIRRLTCPAIIGTFAVTSTQTKQRWMLERESYEFEGIRVTATDLARDYLKVKYGDQKRRITTAQYRDFYDDRRTAPVFAKPCELPKACYVDVKSAYWSILKAVGWDVDYMPGGWLKKKSSVLDFPFPDIKMARNCLVSVAANAYGSMKIWTGEKFILKKSGNSFVNLMLWSLVMDVLHGIATECIGAGAVYCYTDGFICAESIAPQLQDIIHSWGMHSEIKYRGEAHVKGAASYRVGERKTAKYDLQRERSIRKIDETVNISFLKQRMKWFSDRSNRA